MEKNPQNITTNDTTECDKNDVNSLNESFFDLRAECEENDTMYEPDQNLSYELH